MPIGSAIRWVSVASRWIVLLTLLSLGAIKLLSHDHSHDTVRHIGDLASTRVASTLAGVVEIVLGIGLLTAWRGAFSKATLTWLGVLSGISVAFVIVGIPASGCGCFGPRSVPIATRGLILLGLGLLTLLSLDDDRAANSTVAGA